MNNTQYLFLWLLLLPSVLNAQYDKVDSVEVNGIRNPKMLWLDYNTDNRYDLIVYGQDSANTGTLFRLMENRDSLFHQSEQFIHGLSISLLKPVDINRDGIVDLVYSGLYQSDTLTSFLTFDNLQTISSSDSTLLSFEVTDFLYEDLNNDTGLDLLTLKDSLLTVYSGEDTIPLFEEKKIGSFYVSDLKNNGLKDLIYTTPTADTLVHFGLNNGAFDWGKELVFEMADSLVLKGLAVGKWPQADTASMFIYGETIEGASWNGLLGLANDSMLYAKQVLDTTFVKDALIADFNSNGGSDIWLMDKHNKGQILDSIPEFRVWTLLQSEGLEFMEFADWNFDGNIDFAQLLKTDELHFSVEIFENILDVENEPPYGPLYQAGVQSEADLILAWSHGTDDLAIDSVLTYELTLLRVEDSTKVSFSNMSLLSRGLFYAAHGFQEYSQNKVFYGIDPGDYVYAISTVDNAFNINAGTGEYNRCTVCEVEDLITSSELLCRGSVKVYGQEGVERSWYSTSKGPLGKHELLAYTAVENDTLYGSVMSFDECQFGQLQFNISVVDGEAPNLPEEMYICPGDSVNITVSESFIDPVWSTRAEGVISTSHSITYLPTETHTLFFEAQTGQQCTVYEDVEIIPVEFNSSVGDTLYQIQYGQSVQLEATGGTNYKWSPALGLDNPSSSTPIAKPTENTLYSGIIINEWGCSDQFTVMVEVEQVGSVANLFSPNGDGKNDNLVVFLTQLPLNFQFQIFNRSGVLVYETDNPAEAMNSGWDGTNNNQPAPNGMYYWYVKGKYPNGQDVDLNGAKKGTVSLIR